MVPSFGFDVPILGLILGMIVLAVGLFLGGLNAITFAGILIGFASIVALLLAVVATPEPGRESTGERARQ